MKFAIRSVFTAMLVLAMALYPTSTFATAAPIRHGSDVGATSNADFWNLLGPTTTYSLTKVTQITQQVICPGQNVSAATGDETNAGGCSNGVYLWLIQIQSTKATNNVISLRNLVGFTLVENASSPDTSTVGVVQCDTGNTDGLCTTLGTGTAAEFPNVTFTHSTDNTQLNIHIPAPQPVYPAGTGHQGQGLTIFVMTTQSPAVPVAFPRITGG